MRPAIVVLVLLLSRLAVADEVDESLYSCKKNPTAVQVTLKPEAEIKDLVTWVVGFTCKQFTYDPRIISSSRKITVIAPRTQTPAEAYQLFITALGTMGYTVVGKGKTLRIVDASAARGETVPIYHKGLPDGDAVARYVMRPTYTTPDTLQKAFSAIKSKDGDIQVIGSMLVMTDYASNLRDMLSVTKLVDVPGGADGIYTIPVVHADAAKLSDKLGTLLKTDTTGPHDATLVPSKLLVDERTNTLVLAGSQAAFDRVKALVERLDIALDIDSGASMHVYQVGSAVADELAKTVNDAIQNAPKPTTGGKPAEGGLSIEGQARVISDKPTNKLLVMSSGRDFLAIRDVIRQLDVPRRQVYIEATILEVQVGNGLDIGSSSHGGYSLDGGNSMVLGGVQTPTLRSLDLTTLSSASGLIGGLVGKTLTNSQTLLGKSIPSYAILFQALARNSNTNVRSTPSMLVLDNEEAKWKSGTDVPYKRGVLPTSTTTATSSLTTNIDRKPLLLELNVKPHIMTDDSILLEIKQSAEDLGESDSELGPTWTTRGIETRVLVRDQQTVVISGLMQERDISSIAKVPLLGDLPILGYLFKYSTKSKKKTNLLVTLTPYIIKDNIDLDTIRERKQREYDEFFGSLHTLDRMKYEPRIDYRRKRGLLEEINRAVKDSEDDAEQRGKLQPPARVEPGLVAPTT